METIIRVKRPLEEEPTETLLLNYKKRKISDDTEPTLLKFTGTTLSQDEDVHKYVSEYKLKEKLTVDYKKHPVNFEEKLRSQAFEKSKENRYKIVNCLRNDQKGEYTLYDLEVDNVENNPEKQYAYDLYYVSSDVLHDANDYVSLRPMSDELVFEPENESYEDSDDSNAENNWRNNYPDESDCESINEDDICKAVQNCNIDNELSTDDDDYCDEDADVNRSDEEKYGKSYAKFKARYNNSDSSGSDDADNSNSDLLNYYY